MPYCYAIHAGLGQVLPGRKTPVQNAGMVNTPKVSKVANTGIYE